MLTAVIRRQHIPRQRTLFLLDECSQLGALSLLRQAITLLSGSGLQIWTIWQDLSQLRFLYPNDWPTMINNSAVLQAFGINNHQIAKEWSDMLGIDAHALQRLAPEDAMLSIHGQGTRTVRRLD